MFSRIFVPIDGSEPAKLALDEALKLALSANASIRLIHVVDVGTVLSAETSADRYESLVEKSRLEGALLLVQAVASVTSKGLTVDSVLVEASARQVGAVVVRNAREYQADLIICGAYGRPGAYRLSMGRDAEHVVRHRPIPVLMVRVQDPINEVRPGAFGSETRQ